MSKALILICAFTLSLHAWSDEQTLDAPESAFWHAPSQSWFVSSLGGGLSLARDGVGWVSRFDASGKLLAARFVAGLDAPTGMTAVGNSLYVTDRSGLVAVDVATAAIIQRITIADAKFLNDAAAASDGAVYVSDTESNRIYRVAPNGEVIVWLESSELQSPNGLWVDGNTLIVATWGPMTDIATFATKHPGTLLTIDLASKKITPVGQGAPIANFDGVVKAGDSYYATDWTGGRLLRISKTAEVHELLSGFMQLADLGHDPATNTFGLPIMKDNRFILVRPDAFSP